MCMYKSRDDVKAIFDPVIAEVLRFVDGQVKSVKAKRKNKDVTVSRAFCQPTITLQDLLWSLTCSHSQGIFLVGGFGSSHYLKSKIQEQHPDTHVFQPPDAWAAVVKGAVQSRLPREPTVVTTLATKHYGFTFADPYDHEVDSGVQSFFDTRQGVDYVYDRVRLCPILKTACPSLLTSKHNHIRCVGLYKPAIQLNMTKKSNTPSTEI